MTGTRAPAHLWSRAQSRPKDFLLPASGPVFQPWLTESHLTNHESISPTSPFLFPHALLLSLIWNPPPLVSFHLPRAQRCHHPPIRPCLWNILWILDDKKGGSSDCHAPSASQPPGPPHPPTPPCLQACHSPYDPFLGNLDQFWKCRRLRM